jgi:hypothetical protein
MNPTANERAIQCLHGYPESAWKSDLANTIEAEIEAAENAVRESVRESDCRAVCVLCAKPNGYKLRGDVHYNPGFPEEECDASPIRALNKSETE